MKPPLTLSKRIIHKGYFELRADQLQRHDGQEREYTFIELPTSAAVIIAQDAAGRYILNREYRHPTGQTLLGCPGGSLDPGEEPLKAAQRELHEETGYWSDDITPIGACYPIPSLCSQLIYYFHAKNAVPRGAKKLDPFEFIDTELKTEAELFDAMRSGALVDSMLCTALWYKSLAEKR